MQRAFQGIVGIKPTIGVVPTEGVVPACRSLDCVTVFARSIAEAQQAISIMGDPVWPSDAPLAAPPRPVVAVPSRDELAGMSPEWLDAFEKTRPEACPDAF